jgi:hypothetical protein
MKETKDLFNENYKPVKRETEKGIRRWKALHARGLAESTL